MHAIVFATVNLFMHSVVTVVGTFCIILHINCYILIIYIADVLNM